MSLLPALPLKTPRCFETAQQWQLIRRGCVYMRSMGKLSPKFTYCTDCTPEYRDQMVREERCAFPRTTFTKINGITVGVRKR